MSYIQQREARKCIAHARYLLGKAAMDPALALALEKVMVAIEAAAEVGAEASRQADPRNFDPYSR